MKKSKKRVLSFIIMIIVCSVFFTSAQANVISCQLPDDNIFEYTYFGMSAEKAEMIVSSWANGVVKNSQSPTMANLLCLFGHDIQRGGITQMYHNYSTTSPRCKEVFSSVEYCSRSGCGYSNVLYEIVTYCYCH